MTKLLTKIAAVLAGALVAVSLAAVPVSADTPDVEYHIVTGPNEVKYKVITAVNGKPLVDQQGDPAPARVPLVQTMINETGCLTKGGSNYRNDVVRVNHGTWPFDRNTCYKYTGTATVGIGGVDKLYAGIWNGSVYYTTSTQCVARPFSNGDVLDFDNDDLCILSIEF